MKIKTKLLLMLAVTICILVVLSVLLLENSKMIRKKTIGQNTVVFAGELLKRLNNNFRIIIEDIELYSLDSDFTAYLENNLWSDSESARIMMQKLQQRFFTVWGQHRGYQLFRNIHIADINRKIVASTSLNRMETMADPAFFPGVVGNTFVSNEIVYNEKSNDYILPITIPVVARGNRAKCFFLIELSLPSFIQELEIAFDSFELTEILIICERHNSLVYKTGIYKMNSDISDLEYLDKLDGESGFFSVSESNEKYLYSFMRSTSEQRWVSDWTIIVKNNEKEIFAPFVRTSRNVYLSIMMVSLIFIFLNALIIRNINRSVENIRKGALVMGEGNLEFTIQPVSGDELNDVVNALNSMSTNLLNVMANKEELESEVGKRKNAEAELQVLLSKLKQSNKELEQFAYVASHDLQEPLRMVASYTQLLAKRYKEKLDQDANDFIDFAVEGAVRMQSLINSLLEYSRITTKGAEFLEIDTNKLIRDVLKFLEITIRENDANIICNDLEPVKGDENQLFRVFQNLIQNAIKFRNPDIPPEISISSKREKNKIVFSVKDNGIGIGKEYFNHIFIIFKRLYSRNEYQGSGMGLSITKKIVERHGGKIWLESEEEKGTVFYFTLPALKKVKGEKNE